MYGGAYNNIYIYIYIYIFAFCGESDYIFFNLVS